MKLLKNLLLIFLLSYTILVPEQHINAQVTTQWYNPIFPSIRQSLISFTCTFNDYVIYNYRWQGTSSNGQSTRNNQLITLDQGRNEVWTYDWEQEFPENKIRLVQYLNSDEILFFLRPWSPVPNNADDRIGVLKIKEGVLWSRKLTDEGSTRTFSLQEDGFYIIKSSQGIQSLVKLNNKGEEVFKSESPQLVSGDNIFVSEERDQIFVVDDLIGDVSNIYRLDSIGNFLGINKDVPLRPANDEVKIKGGFFHQLSWDHTPRSFVYLKYDANTFESIIRDTFDIDYFQFGRRDLSIDFPNDEDIILSGMRFYDEDNNVASLINYYDKDHNLLWSKTLEGSINDIKLLYQYIFVMTSRGLLLLDVDGNEYWDNFQEEFISYDQPVPFAIDRGNKFYLGFGRGNFTSNDFTNFLNKYKINLLTNTIEQSLEEIKLLKSNLISTELEVYDPNTMNIENIITLNGKQVAKPQMSSYDISHLASGFYIVYIRFNGRLYAKRFFKS